MNKDMRDYLDGVENAISDLKEYGIEWCLNVIKDTPEIMESAYDNGYRDTIRQLIQYKGE